jgi:excinuclease ABC subunit A
MECNLDIIKVADYVIDMGPEGGEGGGSIIVQGTPEEICKKNIGYTAAFLKGELETKIIANP